MSPCSRTKSCTSFRSYDDIGSSATRSPPSAIFAAAASTTRCSCSARASLEPATSSTREVPQIAPGRSATFTVARSPDLPFVTDQLTMSIDASP